MGKSWLSDLTVIVISSPWTVPVWVIVPKLKTAAKEILSPSTLPLLMSAVWSDSATVPVSGSLPD
jgi:hypothetical protein